MGEMCWHTAARHRAENQNNPYWMIPCRTKPALVLETDRSLEKQVQQMYRPIDASILKKGTLYQVTKVKSEINIRVLKGTLCKRNKKEQLDFRKDNR